MGESSAGAVIEHQGWLYKRGAGFKRLPKAGQATSKSTTTTSTRNGAHGSSFPQIPVHLSSSAMSTSQKSYTGSAHFGADNLAAADNKEQSYSYSLGGRSNERSSVKAHLGLPERFGRSSTDASRSNRGYDGTQSSGGGGTTRLSSLPNPTSLIRTALGKQEKLRYFRLFRRAGTEKVVEFSELVYYTGDPNKSKQGKTKTRKGSKLRGRNSKQAKMKGRIVLRAGNKVRVNEECQIELETVGRTFFLRPTVQFAANENEAWTIALQWVHALENAIKKLQAYQAKQSHAMMGSSHQTQLLKPGVGAVDWGTLERPTSGRSAISGRSKKSGKKEGRSRMSHSTMRPNGTIFKTLRKATFSAASGMTMKSFTALHTTGQHSGSQHLPGSIKGGSRTAATSSSGRFVSVNTATGTTGIEDFSYSQSMTASEQSDGEADNYSLASVRTVPDVDYRDIWDQGKLEGYMKILEHLGPVETDSSRLLKYIESRISQVNSRIEVMEELRQSANEPVIKHQKTSFKALRSLYEQDKNRIKVMGATKRALVVLRKAYKDRMEMNKKLVRELLKDQTPMVNKLSNMQKTVTLAMQEVQKKEEHLQRVKENLLSSRLSQISHPDSTSMGVSGTAFRKKSFANFMQANVAAKAKLGGLLTKVRGKLTNSQAKEYEVDDPQELKEDLDNAKKTQQALERQYKSMENSVAKTFRETMLNVQQLEQDRIRKQQQTVKKLTDIEMALHRALLIQVNRISEGRNGEGGLLDGIDAEQDMKNTTTELMNIAAGNREQASRTAHTRLLGERR